jgi:hypothetical protein
MESSQSFTAREGGNRIEGGTFVALDERMRRGDLDQ